MNVLFLSLADFNSLDQPGIYTDLLREFVRQGHKVIAISPIQKRNNRTVDNLSEDNCRIIKPLIGNITDTPFFEKAVSLLSVERLFINCIKDNIGDATIDLFIVATPPVTNDVVINYVKTKYKSKVYLLLKDIWPGNIFKVKMPGGIFTKTFVHLFFKRHEKKLYSLCDQIGCMSQANVDYVIAHTKGLVSSKVHINPNSINPAPVKEIGIRERNEIRSQFGIPADKICFIYGGTLGPGQDINNVVECLRLCEHLDCHFMVVGRGLQQEVIKKYIESEKPRNVSFADWIPKEQYEVLLRACDVGLIFLRYNSNTPSFPSRLLSYMEARLPIVSCVSSVTDLNEVVEAGKFGWGSYSNSPESFFEAVEKCLLSDLNQYKMNSRCYLEENYTVSKSYDIIMAKMIYESDNE